MTTAYLRLGAPREGVFEGRREELKRHVENEKCLLVSPIRKLPDDVLAYIFILCQDTFIRQNDAVESIENVCIHWRVVAHATPRLWSELDIGLTAPGELQNAHATLYKCIKLSGEVPMRLRFGLGDGSRTLPAPESLGSRCMHALAESVHRWHTIDHMQYNIFRAVMMMMPEGSTLERLTSLSLANITGSVIIPEIPNLTELSIEDIADPNARISLQLTGSLRSLKLYGLKYPLHLFPGFRWRKIERFKTKRHVLYREGELLRMLHMMPNLTSLDVFDGLENELVPAIELPQLREFSVRHMCFSLQNLTLPNIQVLHLGSFDSAPADRIDYLAPFLHRSRCIIKTLLLHSPLMKAWRAPELVHVRELYYGENGYNYGYHSFIFEVRWLDRTLSTGENGEPVGGPLILPNLEVLEIQFVELAYEEDLLVLKSMIQSRLPQGGSGDDKDDTMKYLKKVTLKFYRTPQPLVEAWKDFCDSDIPQKSGVVWIVQCW